MKLRNFFKINIFLSIFFGLTGSFYPELWLVMYGLPANDTTIYIIRLSGGSILGFVSLMWFGIKHASPHARKAVAVALFIQDIIGAVASLVFQW